MYKISTLKRQQSVVTTLNLGLKFIVVSIDSLQDLQDLQDLSSLDTSVVCLSSIFNRNDVLASIPLLLQCRYCLALKSVRYALYARQLLKICQLPNFLGCFDSQTANRIGKIFASTSISSLPEVEKKVRKGSYLVWLPEATIWAWTYNENLCLECTPPLLNLKGQDNELQDVETDHSKKMEECPSTNKLGSTSI